MSKLKMHTPDLVGDNIEWVADRFPGCVTESRNEKGEVVRAVDFDLLRQELSVELVEGPRERYHLDWPGKREALLAANSPIAKTLRPCREESVDFDTTRNLFIEGDNLDALKLLQETYLNKVKMIYIDPPYNTGNDFIYCDNFADNASEYLLHSGQYDDAGNRLLANTETNGRFHSAWLSMLYPRLRLARTLLRDDGVIVISIDDNEAPRLRSMCDEVFGESCFINQIAVKSSEASGVKMSHVERRLPKIKEYLLVYGRIAGMARFTPLSVPKQRDTSEELDRYLKYYRSFILNPSDPPEQWEIRAVLDVIKEQGLPEGEESVRQFKLDHAEQVIYRTNNASLAKMQFDTPVAEVLSATGLRYIWWEGKQMLFLKDYLTESLCDLWTDISTINLNKEMLDLPSFSNGQKPLALIERCIEFVCGKDEDTIVMDFFAGSGTTGHAVTKSMVDNEYNRRFILVQLPELIEPNSYSSGAARRLAERTIEFLDNLGCPRTVAEIAKERLRRASDASLADGNLSEGSSALGFRVLKVCSSNLKDVYYCPDETTQSQLDGHVDNIKEDRTHEDLLFQVLLDWGVDLSLPIVKEEIADKPVYFVDTNAIVACFAAGVDDAFVKELAARKPLRVVFRDTSYRSDEVKINVEQIFKQFSPGTEVKTL